MIISEKDISKNDAMAYFQQKGDEYKLDIKLKMEISLFTSRKFY